MPMRLPQDINYKLEYAKPSNFSVVGSHPLKTSARHGDDLILDLMVMMPQVSFSILINTFGVVANEIRICFKKRIISIIDTFTSEPSILHV